MLSKILLLRRLRWEGLKFEASLSYVVRNSHPHGTELVLSLIQYLGTSVFSSVKWELGSVIFRGTFSCVWF